MSDPMETYVAGLAEDLILAVGEEKALKHAQVLAAQSKTWKAVVEWLQSDRQENEQ